MSALWQAPLLGLGADAAAKGFLVLLAAPAAPADTSRRVMRGSGEWETQMMVREGVLTYHDSEPDSAHLRVDARNSLMAWRSGASEMDLRAGGYIHFRETVDGVETEVELREDGRGGVIRTFRVAGVARPWDAEAQRWYERVNQHVYEHTR